LIVGWAALAGWSQEQTIAGALYQVVFILALFGCIVLHELGHALTALRFGIKTRDITLLPIGGLARLERMPKEPLQELAVALAGPAVNVVISAVLAVGLIAAGQYQGFTAQAILEGSMIERLMIVNIFLVLFNLLPAFPMDGGRALRAILATRMGALRATQVAASVGQGMALIFGFLGLFSNPFLVFIALFVWMGAAQEAAMAQAEALLGHVPAERAMIRDFYAVRRDDPLGKVVQLGLTGAQIDFPVLDNGQVVGVLTQTAMLKGLSERGGQGHVEDVMDQDFAVVEATETLEDAFRKLQTCQCRTLPVVRGGQLEGLLTRDNIQAFLSIQNVLAQRHPDAQAPIATRPVGEAPQTTHQPDSLSRA
jgi:Zn-dependent protease/CBS domain-containing protein